MSTQTVTNGGFYLSAPFGAPPFYGYPKQQWLKRPIRKGGEVPPKVTSEIIMPIPIQPRAGLGTDRYRVLYFARPGRGEGPYLITVGPQSCPWFDRHWYRNFAAAIGTKKTRTMTNSCAVFRTAKYGPCAAWSVSFSRQPEILPRPGQGYGGLLIGNRTSGQDFGWILIWKASTSAPAFGRPENRF